MLIFLFTFTLAKSATFEESWVTHRLLILQATLRQTVCSFGIYGRDSRWPSCWKGSQLVCLEGLVCSALMVRMLEIRDQNPPQASGCTHSSTPPSSLSYYFLLPRSFHFLLIFPKFPEGFIVPRGTAIPGVPSVHIEWTEQARVPTPTSKNPLNILSSELDGGDARL